MKFEQYLKLQESVNVDITTFKSKLQSMDVRLSNDGYIPDDEIYIFLNDTNNSNKVYKILIIKFKDDVFHTYKVGGLRRQEFVDDMIIPNDNTGLKLLKRLSMMTSSEVITYIKQNA